MPDADLMKLLSPEKPKEEGEKTGREGLMSLIADKESSTEKVIDSYDNIRIVDTGEVVPIYKVNIPFLSAADKSIIESIQKVATKIIDLKKESTDSRKRKAKLKKQIDDLIAQTSSIKVSSQKKDAFADIVSREMGGYGLIDYLLDDDSIEEVMIVPPTRDVYIFHRTHGMLATNIILDSDEYVKNIIERIARDVWRRIDTHTPLLDARLPSGDRVNATLPPASVDGPTLTIRKFRQDPYTIIDLIKFGTLDSQVAAFLWVAVEGMQVHPANTLVSGGTSSGKTTILNCLSMFIRPTERILTIEDTAELQLPLKHWVRFETRPPSIEGTGEISMDVLLKNSLRMRPDRIIVGEVRHDEAFTLFTAMNTGHQGSMGTIHANTTDETLLRLMSPPMNVPKQMATALDLILSANRIKDPKGKLTRKITEVAEVTGTDEPSLNPVFQWNAYNDKFEFTNTKSQVLKNISKLSGITTAKIQAEIKLRATLLDAAVKKDIHTIDQFSTFIKKYYEKKG
jgi:archaeal flagellar protein FlaI